MSGITETDDDNFASDLTALLPARASPLPLFGEVNIALEIKVIGGQILAHLTLRVPLSLECWT